MDVVGSAALLVLLSPLFALIYLYVRAVSPGPALFRQERIGGGARRFVIYKFRSMRWSADSGAGHREYVAGLVGGQGPAVKPDYRSRLIPGGSWLRALSLDELPQLFNVLRGDMSLIGPRPDVLRLEDYETWQLRRFEVLPGISGLWQVSGKNRLTFDRMVELDIEYIDRWTLRLDAWIAWRTLLVVLLRRNY